MTFTRRDFLKTAGLTGTAALATQLSPLAMAANYDPSIKKMLSASKFGAFEATVKNGEVESVIPFVKDNNPVDMVEHAFRILDNPSRIKKPMVRKGFLTGDKSTRGDNEFVEISWDQAIDILYKQLEHTQVNYGPSGIYAHASWGPVGQLGSCSTTMKRALNLHGKVLGSSGFYSTAAAQAILPEVVGDIEVYSMQTSLDYVAEETEILVLWACDPLKNLKIGFSVPDHSPYKHWDKIKEKVQSGKMRVISIDPVESHTQKHLGGEQLSIKPQTDVAFMMGLCHSLLEAGSVDNEFIELYTEGSEEFFAYLNGDKDGVVKSADWAATICGIAASEIKLLANQMASSRTLISSGWAGQRADHGEQYCWSIVALASMLGDIGLPGGGFSFGYIYNDAGAPYSNGARMGSLSASIKGVKPVHKKKYTSSPYFPTSRIVDVIENPGLETKYKGTDITYPDLKTLIVSGANPFSTHQDINRLVTAINNLDFLVTIDNQWTATCRYSDLVLPCTTIYERDELVSYGNATNRGVIGLKKLVEPMYEAKDDYDIWRMFSAKMDREKEYTGGKTKLQWLQQFYNKARDDNKKNGIEMPVFESFWVQDAAYFEYPGENTFVRHAAFREDPDLNGLSTDSGLIQLFSEKVANADLTDCTPYPSWIPPKDWAERQSGKYLHLVTLHPQNRLHSQLCGVKELRDATNSNEHEPLWINPVDAKAHGIIQGDVVETFNGKGKVYLGAIVSEKVSPGVVASQEGGWYSPEGDACNYGNANVLTTDIGTSSWGQGPTAQTCLVSIKKYQGKTRNIDCFEGPKVVKG